jgi:hypothetical protein
MLRFYSILMVMGGFHVFIIGLMLLAVVIELMARAIAG